MSAAVYHRQVVRATQPVTRGLQKKDAVYELKSADTSIEVDQVLSYEVELAAATKLVFDLVGGTVKEGVGLAVDIFDDEGAQLQLGDLKFLSVVIDGGDDATGVEDFEITLTGATTTIDCADDFGGDFFMLFGGDGMALSDADDVHLALESLDIPATVKVLLGGKLKAGAAAAPGELG